MLLSNIRVSGFCFLLTLCPFATNAHAQDASDFADKLVALTDQGTGNKTKYAAAKMDGSTVVISGFTSQLSDRNAEMTIDQLRLSDPVLEADGGLQAATSFATGVSISSPEMQMTIGEIKGDDIRYPSPSLPAAEFAVKMRSAYSSMEANNIVIHTEQNEKLPIARVALSNKEIVDGIAHDVNFIVEGIVIDTQLAGDAEARERATALGYDKITLGASFHARWDEAAGLLHFDRFELGGKDVGYLSISASIGGITRALTMASTQEEAGAQLQNVTLNAASIRFTNDSIMERVVAQYAAEEGTTPDAMIDATLVQLPDVMAALGSPDLAAQATEALSTFLRSPKTLTVQAKPDAAVPVMQIFGMAMMAPGAAIAMLKLDIKANE